MSCGREGAIIYRTEVGSNSSLLKHVIMLIFVFWFIGALVINRCFVMQPCGPTLAPRDPCHNSQQHVVAWPWQLSLELLGGGGQLELLGPGELQFREKLVEGERGADAGWQDQRWQDLPQPEPQPHVVKGSGNNKGLPMTNTDLPHANDWQAQETQKIIPDETMHLEIPTELQ